MKEILFLIMKPFKFFSDNEENPDDDYNGASWLFIRPENINQYDIITVTHNGIRQFLDCFPPLYILRLISITGPNGRVHNIDTYYDDGWGFDITSDLITIRWVSFS
jgi:hypothetical protein